MNRNFWISPNNEEFVAKTSFNKLEEDNIILNVFWGIVFGNSYYSETIKTGTNNCKIINNLKCLVQTWIYRTDHGLLIILQLQQIAMLAGILIFLQIILNRSMANWTFTKIIFFLCDWQLQYSQKEFWELQNSHILKTNKWLMYRQDSVAPA